MIWYKSLKFKKGFISDFYGVNFRVEKGEFICLLGTSGSGKSTLLNIIGGIDSPTSGKVFIDDKDISNLSDKEITLFRNKTCGFIFQSFF